MDEPYSLLPWRVEVIGQNDCKNNVCNVRGANGNTAAEYLAEEDAAYIVRACNSHAALVEAVRHLARMESWTAPKGISSTIFADYIRQAQLALKQAEE